MWQVSYDGEEWEDVEEARAERMLSGNYDNVTLIMDGMKESGLPVRTMFGRYRWVESD